MVTWATMAWEVEWVETWACEAIWAVAWEAGWEEIWVATWEAWVVAWEEEWVEAWVEIWGEASTVAWTTPTSQSSRQIATKATALELATLPTALAWEEAEGGCLAAWEWEEAWEE